MGLRRPRPLTIKRVQLTENGFRIVKRKYRDVPRRMLRALRHR